MSNPLDVARLSGLSARYENFKKLLELATDPAKRLAILEEMKLLMDEANETYTRYLAQLPK